MSLDYSLIKKVHDLESKGFVILISDNGLLIINNKSNTTQQLAASKLIIVE